MSSLTGYRIARDIALERCDAHGVLAAERGAEMWHRPPEEWELERVETWRPSAWIAFDGLAFRAGDSVTIDGRRSDISDARSLIDAINAAPLMYVARVEDNRIWIEPRPLEPSTVTHFAATWDNNLYASGPKDRRHTNSSVPLFVRNASKRMDGRRRA